MNNLIYETIFFIDADKISLSRIDLFIMSMEEYGVSMKIITDDVIQSMYRVMVQRRNIGPEFKFIAKYVQEHNLEVCALHYEEEWIRYAPELYAKINGLKYYPQKYEENNCKRQKIDSNDLSTIF